MTTPLTVADLRWMLEKLPDDTQLWVFNERAHGTPAPFLPIVHMTHDKRLKGLNFWIDTSNHDSFD
jgi:hypothetical protein